MRDMRDMITVFNQLTQSELADSSMFEDVLINHYEQFKYFYRLMQPIDLANISVIYCVLDQNTGLVINVNFIQVSDKDKFIKTFNNRLESVKTDFSDYFLSEIHNKKRSKNISIEIKSICREDEMYGDRFNSY